jgi:DUF1009 family protein
MMLSAEVGRVLNDRIAGNLDSIAGNGKFPFLVLDAARAQGYEVVVAAIKEETFPRSLARGGFGSLALSGRAFEAHRHF